MWMCSMAFVFVWIFHILQSFLAYFGSTECNVCMYVWKNILRISTQLNVIFTHISRQRKSLEYKVYVMLQLPMQLSLLHKTHITVMCCIYSLPLCATAQGQQGAKQTSKSLRKKQQYINTVFELPAALKHYMTPPPPTHTHTHTVISILAVCDRTWHAKITGAYE
jgi:hypothetical protein